MMRSRIQSVSLMTTPRDCERLMQQATPEYREGQTLHLPNATDPLDSRKDTGHPLMGI